MNIEPRNYKPAVNTTRMFTVLAGAGLILLAISVVFTPERAWGNLMVALFTLIGLGLAGLLFIALEYVTGAGWSVALRRIPEAMAGILPLALGGMLVLLIVAVAGHSAYVFGHGEHDPGTFWFKELWLQPAFFIVRSILYVTAWIVFSKKILGQSRKQDTSDGPLTEREGLGLSAGFLILFAVSFSLASIDWLMALNPMWFSTMFGVYSFSGSFLGGLAVISLLACAFYEKGPWRGIIQKHHLHDLGKLLFGFSCFWMYIWFCQYMLIWYSNIPEETGYYIGRHQGAWAPLVIANLVLNWGLPFLVLLPRPCKESPSVLSKIAVAILVGRWLDVYLIVMPFSVIDTPKFGLADAGAPLAALGLFALFFIRAIKKGSIVPINDPYLGESLGRESRHPGKFSEIIHHG